MEILFYTIFFISWLIFWSFASVIIYRIRSWESWIFNWRSHCNSCNKILWALDLVPIFSWFINRWRCRTCKAKISSIYPLLEISTWILFLLIWIFLIDLNLLLSLNILEITKLIFFLAIWFFTIIYIFYDILFLEIPEPILIIWVILTLIILSLQTLFENFLIIENIWVSGTSVSIWTQAIILSCLIILWLYTIMLKWLKELTDIIILLVCIIWLMLFKYIYQIELWSIAILNWTIWAIAIFIFFFLQILISKWKWIGWWDLRIAVLIWLIMWTSLSFPWMMMVYLVWSIISIWLIIIWKILKKTKWLEFNSMVPFWPFLWIWFFIALFSQKEIFIIIEKYFTI